jgi:predicted transcriptional regulator
MDHIAAIRQAANAASIGPRELARQAGISTSLAHRLLSGDLSRRDVAVAAAMKALGLRCDTLSRVRDAC